MQMLLFFVLIRINTSVSDLASRSALFHTGNTDGEKYFGRTGELFLYSRELSQKCVAILPIHEHFVSMILTLTRNPTIPTRNGSCSYKRKCIFFALRNTSTSVKLIERDRSVS